VSATRRTSRRCCGVPKRTRWRDTIKCVSAVVVVVLFLCACVVVLCIESESVCVSQEAVYDYEAVTKQDSSPQTASLLRQVLC
jgi:hypothetical protein